MQKSHNKNLMPSKLISPHTVVPAKDVEIVQINLSHQRRSTGWSLAMGTIDLGPMISLEVVAVHVRKALVTRVSSVQEHGLSIFREMKHQRTERSSSEDSTHEMAILKLSCLARILTETAGMKVPGTRNRSQAWHFGPCICRQIASEKVTLSVETIISALDVDVCVIFGPCWTGTNRQ